MSDTNEARIRQIYDLALEKPAGQRDEFVHRVCGDDALAERVLALLSAQDEMGEFLAEPTGAASAPEPQPDPERAGEQPGMVIGKYKLLHEIGEGGMGVVWLAEQFKPVRRRVALKVIKLGMDTKQVVARFEAERQALALMDHPSIAKVLDGGMTPEGRPFFVMEFVKGVPITAFCDEQRLGLRERLELFGSVCQAVQHAHHKGIIHRDIKPANVLVTLHDGRPVPKVIDFGIAKATNQELTQKTLFTEYAQILGTPEYMAPEQASMSGLDIDTRADVYALGVLLYELLSGSKPFDLKTLLTRGYEEMLRTIREDDPPKPSTRASSTDDDTARRVSIARQMRPGHLGKELRGDLDWIVIKAMEKDRTRRYETANGLAADVLRFLGDEPVTATPPSAVYRARKFVRRNKGLVAASIIVLGVLLAGIAGTGWGLVRAVEQKERAGKAERDTARELARANEVKRLLTEMLETVDPNTAQGEDVTLLKRILDDTGKRLLAGEIEDESIAAELHEVIGNTYMGLALYDEAGPHIKKALTIRTQEFGSVARPVLALRRLHGRRLEEQTRLAEARTLLRAVYEDSRRVLGEDDIETAWCVRALANVAAGEGRSQDYLRHSETALSTVLRLDADRDTRVSFMMTHAGALRTVGRAHDAERLYRQILDLANRDRSDNPLRVVWVRESFANVLVSMGRYEEADAEYRYAVRERRRISGPNHPATLSAIGNRALGLTKARRFAEADEILVDARRRAVQHLGPDSLQALYLGLRLVHNLVELGRLAEADALGAEVLERCERRFGPGFTWTAESQRFLALSKAGQYDFAAAVPLFQAVLEAQRRLQGPESPDSRYVRMYLAYCLQKTGRNKDAVRLAREALARAPDDVAGRIEVTAGVGEILALSGHTDEGLGHLREALAEARNCKTPLVLEGVLLRLGKALIVAGENGEAVVVLQEAIPLIEVREVSASGVAAWGNLGAALWNVDRFEEALRVYRDGLVHANRLLGKKHPLTLHLRLWLARSLMSLNRFPEALPILEEIAPLQVEVRGAEHEETLDTHKRLAWALVQNRRPAEALEILERTLAVRRRVEGAESLSVLDASVTLSGVAIYAGKYDKAIEVGSLVVERAPADHPMWLRAARLLVGALRLKGQMDEVAHIEARIEKALRGTEQQKEMQRAEQALMTGDFLEGARRYAAAKERFLVSLEHMRNAVGDGHPALISVFFKLYSATYELKEYAEAEKYARQALRIMRRTFPADHRDLLGGLANLGRALRQQEKYEEARVVIEESLAGLRRTFPKGHPWTSSVRFNLFHCYLGLGRRADAIRLLREQTELDVAPAADPNANARTLNHAAGSLLTSELPEVRDPARALKLARRMMALAGVEEDENYWRYLDTFAHALFQTGDVEEAIAAKKRAIAAAPAKERPELRKPLVRFEAALKEREDGAAAGDE